MLRREDSTDAIFDNHLVTKMFGVTPSPQHQRVYARVQRALRRERGKGVSGPGVAYRNRSTIAQRSFGSSPYSASRAMIPAIRSDISFGAI